MEFALTGPPENGSTFCEGSVMLMPVATVPPRVGGTNRPGRL